MNRDYTVILPTLNEAKNITPLIQNILRLYGGMRIIVVDDGSTDGTCAAVKKLASRYRNITLLDRGTLGLTAGLTASVTDGIKASRSKYAIVMDADLQHPVETIGDIARSLSAGVDLAVAIRESVHNWPFYRKSISKLLSFLGYAMLVLRGNERCSDIFSGFFGVKRELFISTYSRNKRRFVLGGYKVLFDFLKCFDKGSIIIKEIPYAFGLRNAGSSKAGAKQVMFLIKSFLT